ncbi:MFS-type transporter, Atg22 family [Terrimicrobium sacchariphilum]|uniref:MFS-type transporter, Atg22 family n=1 Tax=Terrimicrobium sacchariphilum TaxID=690879 RepID=A0A146G9V1_TERSA|nr:MFS transporter [Terrimicrobium sacchariphilum]GAT34429.1 MFS-type transporter, Atg22 family [Terrimicrobium sacchariphilum]
MNSTPISSPLPGTQPGVYTAGSLVYSKKSLMVLSLWLLWGDFAFYFFETVFGRFLPLFLKDLQASNTMIGVMTGSFAGLVNVLFLPSISRWCDNLRTPLGRRIPLLIVATPLTASMVVAVGFAPEMAKWISSNFFHLLPGGTSEKNIVIWLMCVFVVSFHFLNMVLVNAYNWLIRDVVPLPVMSRFLAWFTIIGTLSSAVFLFFVFPHLSTHRHEIFIGVGVAYTILFLLMCWKVKEGNYPPPQPASERTGFFKTFIVYFRECLQIPLYRYFFLAYLLVTASLNCAGNFITLFAGNTLHLDMNEMGHVFGWTAVISLVFSYPIGWLCDRFSPIHVAIASISAIIAGALLAFFFIGSATGFLVYSLAFSLPTMAWALAQRATSMKLFPAEYFGQFSSGLNVFGCGALIIGNILIGILMDASGSNYRVAFLWTVGISASALIPMVLVLRGWQQHGGHDNYVPPLPSR